MTDLKKVYPETISVLLGIASEVIEGENFGEKLLVGDIDEDIIIRTNVFIVAGAKNRVYIETAVKQWLDGLEKNRKKGGNYGRSRIERGEASLESKNYG